MKTEPYEVSEAPDIAPTKTDYKCPLCGEPLYTLPGSRTRPTIGVTMFDLNQRCEAQEVTGYGTNAAAAFKIIKEKYVRNDSTRRL